MYVKYEQVSETREEYGHVKALVTEPIAELTTVNDIVWELAFRGIITDKELWLKKLEEDTNSYWLARKAANYIRNNG